MIHSADLAPVYSNVLLINLQMEVLRWHSEAFQMQSDNAYVTLLRLLSQALSYVIRENKLWRLPFIPKKSTGMLMRQM